jgi:2-furoyl-CoA dehydrogenase large subunit
VEPAAGAGHVLTGTGETTVPAALEDVWRTLLDPDSLARVIPGCHELELVGENSYRAEVSLGVGPVRGRFIAGVRLSDLDPPRAVTLSGDLAGPLGSSRGRGNLRLEADGDGTRVSYEYEIEISGTVAAVGGRMLDGASRIVIGQFFERLVGHLGGGEGSDGPSAGGSWWQRLLRLLGMGG